ncbi:transposase [Bradyrhizobium sp. LTSPM299]|uniref:IS110 family transposase n=1 Tax=Bradyrhizobium sp. LTSPM299 TaxID=1619233 RepID=UPI000B2DDCA0|nr:transposase [Bradyrhizobium sp. LTSPM299]
MAKRTTMCAGIDTGKRKLDVAFDSSTERLQVENTVEGYKTLVEWLRRHKVKRVGIEASGGYEQAVVAELRCKRFVVVVFQPAQVRSYAKFRLQRAKNDKIDAALIAACTAAVRKIYAAPDAKLLPFAGHLTMIDQIGEDIAKLKNRLESCRDGRIQKLWKEDIARLAKRERAEFKALVAAIRARRDLAARLDLIYSVSGSGLLTAVAILVRMPEIGLLTREQVAALAGLAPYDDDSGDRLGSRQIDGGRKRLRRALYTAALPASFRWNPQLIALYRRLIAAGKGHKRALIACAPGSCSFSSTPSWPAGHRGKTSHRWPLPSRPADPFLCSIGAPFLRPDLPSQRRRAQRPSRMAVAQTPPHTPPSTGHALTAASTTSGSTAIGQSNREQPQDLIVATGSS